jgi:hypothetical protein
VHAVEDGDVGQRQREIERGLARRGDDDGNAGQRAGAGERLVPHLVDGVGEGHDARGAALARPRAVRVTDERNAGAALGERAHARDGEGGLARAPEGRAADRHDARALAPRERLHQTAFCRAHPRRFEGAREPAVDSSFFERARDEPHGRQTTPRSPGHPPRPTTGTLRRVLPTVCTRCKRTSSEWTVERTERRAGCPCGEVIAVTFDDDIAPLARPRLSGTPRRPRGWREEQREDGWRATFTPDKTWLRVVVPLVVAGVLVAAGAIRGTPLPFAYIAMELVTAVGFVAAVMAWQHRAWAFSVERGRLEVSARGKRIDVALSEILGFVVAGVEPRRPTVETPRGSFRLEIVRADQQPVVLPLLARDEAEAQFVCDRLAEVLASGGRETNAGYRGEHLRVETDAPLLRVDTKQDEAPEDDETEDEAKKRRSSE